jgi:hypothetical protein
VQGGFNEGGNSLAHHLVWNSLLSLGVEASSTVSLMLMSREKSGQRAPPSLTLNRLLQFSRQAQTTQL